TINDPTTITAKLRQGVHWQNKAPVNGREFTADDVVFHYNRLLGTGSGYIYPALMYGGMTATWDRVTAIDKYTVVFKFKQPSAQNFQTIADNFALNEMDAPEWVALGGPPKNEPPAPGGAPVGGGGGPPPSPPPASGPLADWKSVVGTGPWMLTDFVSGSSFKFSKNPDYWGKDPRYPQNQLPYADTLTLLVIPDGSTRLAAITTAKVDVLGAGNNTALNWQQAQQLSKTNPYLQQQKVPAGASGIGLKVNEKPFTDIRVRQALDMAINRPAIAQGYYGGTSSQDSVGLFTSTYAGIAYAYADWPQSLKDQYAYNPTGAKKLLADAGYPNGFDTNVVTTNDANGLQLMQVFQSYFSDIGVKMEIRPMDSAAEQAFTRDGKHDQMSAHAFAYIMPPTRVMDVFYSKGGSDAVFYGLDKVPDTKYDTLHDNFIAATDSTTAMQLLQSMDKHVIEQHYVIAAPESYNFNIWLPTLKGYSGENLGWGQGLTLSRLWTTNK
ncbi:MAG: ABC transporter substrate-binding protein, partial [Dehalococcoidia bacterium]